MAADRVEGLLLQVGFARVVHQQAIERRRVHGCGRPAIEDDAPPSRVVSEADVGWQWNLDSNRGVFSDPKCPGDAVIESIVKKQWIVRVFGQTGARIFWRERAGFFGMAGPTRAPVATERLHIEESSTLPMPESGAGIRQTRIAFGSQELVSSGGLTVLSDRAAVASGKSEQEGAPTNDGHSIFEIH
jgi:hypothetical protein